jgi:hypothetical protein
LSYTQFEYSGLAVADHDVSVTVRNAGPRAGAEAVQLYLGPPTPALVPMVYWPTERHDWVIAAGERTVFVRGQSTVISGPNAAVTQPPPPNR